MRKTMVRGDSYAVILAGGGGERLWPLSTPERPKQFVELFGGKPLIRHAADRLAGLIPPERILVITAARFVAQTRAALPMVPPENIVGEPCRRDTAAAVAVAVGMVRARGGADAVGAILTADQLMTPEEAFRRVLGDALAVAARSDAIVTLGVEPDHPATGFGYIARAEKVDFGTASEFAKVERFVEKPDLETAKAYLATGRYSWNAGMFIWKASTMAAAFAAHAPEFSGLIDAVAAAPDVEAVMAVRYPAIRATSVDYAVMEKATNILVARCAFTWDDVGGWNAIAAHFPADARGNVRLGKTAVYDAGNNIIVSDDAHVTAVVGLENVVVVHTPHATLVCARDRAQDVKQLVRSCFPPCG